MIDDADVARKADEWVSETYPVRKRPKYGDGDFSEYDMESAYVAGYCAALMRGVQRVIT
ncbi:hypothetical protein [Mesorhizobium sp.]|uniref:hypothetical protein n=1 Tax=Mesorhizobium sp. TaxID=1871066 RepID=UPI00257F6014|nr:hypothetical protein [Mesorhizobium sp.]